MLNTHEQIKELKQSDLSEKQAEGIVEFVDRNNKALIQVFNNRFDMLNARLERLETILEKRFDAADKKFESINRKFEFLEAKMDAHRGQIMTWIGVGIAFVSVIVGIATIYGK